MSENPVIKTVILACLFAVTGNNTTHAQRMITLDNEICVLGLETLSDLASAKIKPASQPRKFGSECRAQNVAVTSVKGVTLKLDRLEWDARAFETLASGTVPKALKLSVTGARVLNAPDDQLIWFYLAGRANGAQNMDAVIELGHLPDAKKLLLRQALIDFQNGNSISVKAVFSGVSPKLPRNPVLAAVSFFLDDMSLTITSGTSTANPALAILLAQLRKDMPDASLGAVKDNAKSIVAKELGPILGTIDLADLKRLITDLPRAKGQIGLKLKPAKGYALVRLALLDLDKGLAAAFEGLEINFTYSPRAN